MSDVLKAAFIFVSPTANCQIDWAWVKTDDVHVKTIAVKNYQQACELIDDLCQEGIKAIELCAGFGHLGVAHMVEAAKGRVEMGVVRFDPHPGLGFVSGDRLFNQSTITEKNRL
ncbi:DUF6506 family protein [Pragia fontium]|uniref:DUF6506 family protein n=1 Tax=Pragia fontium TaxID=82985 RepID=UPI000F7212AB|nr:DUF6506 family protein [Pragia fontium]VEJ53747.1 Uncharacterised protein [Pragia fontium]